jgi:hypothetical protein
VLTDLVADERPRAGRPVLCGFESQQPFAYARGANYFRCVDHTLLARVVDGQLLSGRSGEPIAYMRGDIFYDAITRKPVYYRSSETDDVDGLTSHVEGREARPSGR